MPSRPRRRFLVLAVVGTAVALAVGVWLIRPRTAITVENAARIQPGMTLAEVEAILGGPARDERTGFTQLDLSAAEPAEVRRRRRCAMMIGLAGNGEGAPIWRSDFALILVDTIDDEEHVTATYVVPLRPEREPPLDRLRRWLGL
jgi:hypothetical protein